MTHPVQDSVAPAGGLCPTTLEGPPASLLCSNAVVLHLWYYLRQTITLFTAAGCLCNPFDVRRVVCSP